jgi:hypothetical protein
MGGGEAEELVFERPAIGSVSDDQQIAAMLEPGEESALRDQVRELLRWNEGTLKYLAAQLLRHRILLGTDVVRMVRGGARIRRQAAHAVLGGAGIGSLAQPRACAHKSRLLRQSLAAGNNGRG